MKKLKITNNAPVVLGFALACFAVLILGFLTGGKSSRLLHNILSLIMSLIMQ